VRVGAGLPVDRRCPSGSEHQRQPKSHRPQSQRVQIDAQRRVIAALMVTLQETKHEPLAQNASLRLSGTDATPRKLLSITQARVRVGKG
jgi:hypothetical protein